MGSRPGDALHVHPDAGVLALEPVGELAHDLALVTHGPEAHDGALRLRRPVRRAAGERRGEGERGGERDAARAAASRHRPTVVESSHPPVNPARLNPRTRCSLRRMVRHTRPLR